MATRFLDRHPEKRRISIVDDDRSLRTILPKTLRFYVGDVDVAVCLLPRYPAMPMTPLAMVAMAAGAVDMLHKPFEPDTLRKTFQRAFEAQGGASSSTVP